MQKQVFGGEYVFVYDEWFFGSDNNIKLKEKINSEYDLIGNYYSFSVTCDLFERQKEIRMNEVYKRKL